MSFEIVERETGTVVHVVPSTTQGRQRERVLDGLERNLDHEHYFVRDADVYALELEAAVKAAARPTQRGRPSSLA